MCHTGTSPSHMFCPYSLTGGAELMMRERAGYPPDCQSCRMGSGGGGGKATLL